LGSENYKCNLTRESERKFFQKTLRCSLPQLDLKPGCISRVSVFKRRMDYPLASTLFQWDDGKTTNVDLVIVDLHLVFVCS